MAVVVTHDPGPWFDSALAALAAQDYGDMSVLVIDAASSEDPTSRVAAVAPDAFVRRLANDPGWAAAANEALGMVQGAAYLLFCHDDVAPAPDAVRLLVEEAYRSNAGVIGPKIVDWDEHVRIISVGETIDKTGVVAPMVDPGELDQEQHDAVRDVFAVDGAFMLVRADLAVSLGGFEPKLVAPRRGHRLLLARPDRRRPRDRRARSARVAPRRDPRRIPRRAASPDRAPDRRDRRASS